MVTLLMFGGLVVGVLIGYPLALVVGFVSLSVGYLVFGPSVSKLLYDRLLGQIMNYTLLAIPLFVFMGAMLESSGITKKLYDTLFLLLGGLRGGLAIVTVLVGTIMAACVGVVGASVTMIGMIALPAMLSRGYDKSFACGATCASGVLGNLIPPSILLVIYGPMAAISVGKLYMGAVFPGLLLSALYCTYIVVRCLLQPQLAPVVPVQERAVPLGAKVRQLLISLLPPVILIFSVLGSIFFGIAPPTEAAAMGALMSIVLAIAYRTFSFSVLKEVTLRTLNVTSMIYLISALSFAFTGVFLGAGCGKVVEDVILAMPGGRWMTLFIIMFIIFILGFFIDVIGIIFIMVPIISPLAPKLGFDPVWFGILVNVNFQMAFMTPPFAVAIFYLKGIALPEWGIEIGDIIRGVWPFIGLIALGILLCCLFPEIVLWLPSKMIK